MKKSYLALGLVAAVAMSSCSNDEPMPNGNGNQNLAQGFEPVKLSMTTSTADVEVSGARTRGTGTVGDVEGGATQWQYEDIYVLMTSTQDKTVGKYDNGVDGPSWGFTSALGNGPFLLDQFDGSFWARPNVVNNAVSVLDYTIDRNEWWYGGPIERFYPLSGGSHFFAYHIDDAEDVPSLVAIPQESIDNGREFSHKYSNPVIENEKDMYINFDMNGSQDLMAGYAAVPTDKYCDVDGGFSARSARAGAVPQISMKHLLSRLTFEVVKGCEHFDRVTLNSITVNSKDKGKLYVATNPDDVTDPASWAKVGQIDWNAESAEDFALMQIAPKYNVDADNKTTGIYSFEDNPYDVYYNIYDGLYWMKPGVEKVNFEGEDLAAIEEAVALDGAWVNGTNEQNGHVVCVEEVEGVKNYYWENPIKTKTEIEYAATELTTKPEANPAGTSTIEGGKAKLVDFAHVALKDFALADGQSKSVGEAMFVAPGENKYALQLNMTYLVRSGEESADMIQLKKDLQTAKNTVTARNNDLAEAEEALAIEVTELEEAKNAAEDAEAAWEANPLDDALKTAWDTALAALATAQEEYDDAVAAVAAAEAAVAEAEAAVVAAEDAIKMVPDVTEDMVQTLYLVLPQDEKFEAGKSYNVKVTIYGYEPAEIEVKLEPWVEAGDFEVGGDNVNEDGKWTPKN